MMAIRNKEIEKRSETIQQYFNKINITRIRDLITPTDRRGEESTFAFSAYRTSVENLTVIDQSRLQRYREYEQMCYVPELNGGLELYCFTGDTKIYTPTGFITVRELVEKNIKDFYVFSYDFKKHKVVCAKANNAHKSGESKTLKITLDDGSSIRVTPHHKFLLRNEKWIKAKNLSVGDSLMPLYTRIRDERVQINNLAGDWVKRFRIVGELKYGDLPKGHQIHHVDLNKSNDSPENLTLLTTEEHLSLHHIDVPRGSIGDKDWWLIEANRKAHSDRVSKRNKLMWAEKRSELINAIKTGVAQSNYDRHWTDKEKSDFSEYIKNKYKSDPYYKLKVSNLGSKNGRFVKSVSYSDLFEIAKTSDNSIDFHKNCNNLLNVSYRVTDRLLKPMRLTPLKLINLAKNHKVVSIEISEEVEEVFDITVPSYNNFATDSIFIHNSDDASLYNEKDEVVEIDSDNQEISDTLDDLWFKSLDMNSVLWHIVYNTCKYGDAFYEIIPDSYSNPKKIKHIRFVPPQFVVRREKDANLLEFVVRITPDSRTPTSATYYSSAEASEFVLKPWQMVHFKLDDKEFDPYGKSVLEPGRLAFKQMKLIEDAMMIYRMSRAPERRVFGIPVGNLPYREAMKRVEDIKTRYRKTPWIDPTSGEINYNANPLCLALDTKIDLLDGRSESLSTLIEEFKSGKENWVYSVDTSRNNKIVPGKIEWAGITRKNAELVEVFIDNGKSIKCTPDHKFMLRDGSYKEARDLVAGESLMPKYTKTSKKGYEKIFDPNTRKYIPTYMMVVRETQSSLWNKKYSKKHIHHYDLRKINNSPSNLKILESVEHLRLHAIHNKENWQNNEYRAKQITSRIKAWVNASNERRQLQSEIMIEYNKSDAHKRSTIARNNKFWADVENRKRTSSKMRKPKSTTEKMHIKFDDKFWGFVDTAIKTYNMQNEVVEALNSNDEFLNHFVSITPRSNKQIHRHLLTKAYRSKGFDTFKEYSSFVKNGENHKVVSVEYLDYKEDTGCITVTEWHNFMTNGTTVKNSINDDFFLPRRPDGSGITIDYLPGGQQLGEIDDVRYFKEKILRTMRIPMAYLTGELTGDVARTSLSAMDVRFAKAIERIQKQVIKGLEKLAIIELAFKRFTIQDMHEFRIKLTPPSKIYEIQELETLTAKFNTIQTALQMADDQGKLYLPREWLYKNISKFTEQEISNIKLMQQREAAEKAEPGAAGAGAEAGGGLTMGGAPGGGVPGGGLEAGAAGPEAGIEAGGAVAAGPEAGGAPEEIPAAGGGEAALTAAQILKVAGQQFLVENEDDLRELIKFVKQYKENEKITKDKSEQKPERKMYENNFENLFLHGELKGLIRRRNNNNQKKEMLKD